MNDEIRQLFPVTQHCTYLNHAAVGVLPVPVYTAMERHLRDQRDHGAINYLDWFAAVKRTRELCAQFINAQPDEIAFAPNTSAGLAMIANGIGWRAGDNLVTAACEFPANVIPWQRVARKHGVEIRFAQERDGRLETEEILSLIDERTRAVTLSFVEFASGFRNDLVTIGRHCRARDILFVVDAIQGLGALRLDVQAACIDALAADAHKFLLGPEGVALFYVSRRALERVKPTLVGWLSVERPFDMDNFNQPWAANAQRFEPGALNTAGVRGLGAAVELFLQVGLERIETHLLELGDYLCTGLRERGYQLVSSRRPDEASAIIACQHDHHTAEQLYQQLEAQQIITTARLGRLRISPHFYNTHADIERLLEHLPQ
ncbi:MAG: aminotransferase class V-fold PLP-dependent enzyme [Acidobacteria bacterium]|nr:aminotransferase class V-fold PLP-dependent enzyme [Acidobacteriota bacterium]MBI3421860.1 aminotransferase class V-fold PLP-dependent enzyme [Acidobacteriota bacterium]